MNDGDGNPAIWWVYLLACAGGRTYTGVALDVEARFRMHASGKGARFTRANPPVSILGAQPFPTRSLALKAEYALKQLRPADKRAWARQWPCSRPKSPRSRTLLASSQPRS